MKWAEIAFVPDPETVSALNEAWGWEFQQPVRPFLSSMFGGVFFETPSGAVRWFECGTGLFEEVAASRAAFDEFLGGKRDETWEARVDEWFLPSFVNELRALGLQPDSHQCYGLTTLPIFAGGTYTANNVFICPVREWFIYTGDIHRQVANLTDGERVRLVVKWRRTHRLAVTVEVGGIRRDRAGYRGIRRASCPALAARSERPFRVAARSERTRRAS